MRDTTPPTVTWLATINAGDSFVYGTVPAASTCNAGDTLSGAGTCDVTGWSDAVGTQTLTATAYDLAGNSTVETRSYTVTPISVTALAPSAADGTTCTGSTPDPGSITIPAVTGVDYAINGVATASGTFPFSAGSYTVTATARPNYELSGTVSWTLNIAAATCVVPVEYVGSINQGFAVTSPSPLPAGVAGCWWVSGVGNVCNVAYPAATQAGDLVVALLRKGGQSAPAAPSGWTKIGPTLQTGNLFVGYQTSAAFSKIVVRGENPVTGPWAADASMVMVTYRHASLGAVAGAVGAAVPALTLQDSSGTSWVAGLLAKSGTAALASVAGMTARSNPANTYAAAFDSAVGVATWAAHPATGVQHAFAIELKLAP